MADETADDIGADILASMNELTGTETPAPVIEAAPEAEAETGERARDEQGRFAPKRSTNGTIDDPAKAGQSLDAQAQEPAKTILPPKSWTPSAKAQFATLHPDVQAEVLRREKEIDDGKAQWDTKAEQFNRLDAALAPVKDRLAINGLTPHQYVEALVSADSMLRANPAQAFPLLAQQYGFDLRSLFGQQQNFQAQPQQFAQQPDPQTLQQMARAEAKALLDEEREAQAQAQAQAEIERFAADPKNIYFSNVTKEMSTLIKSGSATTVEEAYDMAIHARPDIRPLIQATAKPAQARPAGRQVTGSPGQTAPVRKGGSNDIEDDVRAAYAETVGRV